MALFSRGHIGLDIGTSAVRAAEIRGGDKRPQVARFGQVLLPRGAVVDGEVQEPDIVAQAIGTLWKRAGFGTKDVRVGVANRRVVVRQLELPAMSRTDLEGAIRFQAQDYIPIPLAEAVMDFEVIEEFLNDEGQPEVRVLVVAAERTMVDPLLAAVQGAKLEPQVLELNAYPLMRALGTDEPVSSEAEALVDVGGGVTNVVIHQGGKIRFTRMLPSLGGDDFTQAISESLGLDWEEAESLKTRASPVLAQRLGVPDEVPPSSFELPAEEAAPSADTDPDVFGSPDEDTTETFDRGTEDSGEGFFGESRPTEGGEPQRNEEPPDLFGGASSSYGDSSYGSTPPEPPASRSSDAGNEVDQEVERAADVLDSVLQRFVRELRGSVDFYTTQSDALPIERVVITGGGSLLGGLRSQVESALRLPVEPGRVFSRVPVGKVKLSPEQVSVAEPFLAIAVGLGLGGLAG